MLGRTWPGRFAWRDWLWASGASTFVAATVTLASPIMAAGAFCGIAALAVIAARPEIGLLLTVASIPLEQMGVLWQEGYLRISLQKLFAGLTLVVWLAGVVLMWRRVWVPRVAQMFGLYVLAGAISLIGAPALGPGISMLQRNIVTLVFIILVANLLDSWPKLARALIVFSVFTVLVGGFGVSQQFFSGFTYSQEIHDARDKVQYGAVDDTVELEFLNRSVVRSGGASFHPIVLGFASILMLPIFAWGVFNLRALWLRILSAGGFVVHIAALVSSGSRSGLVAFVGVAILLVLKRIIPINRFTIVAAIASCVIAWPLIPTDLKERVFNPDAYQVGNSDSLYYRLDLFKAGMQVFLENPVTGIGLGNRTEINRYMTKWDFEGHEFGAHNMFVQVLLETGILGLASILALFGYLLYGFNLAARQWLAVGNQARAQLCRALNVCVWAVLLQGLSLDMMAIAMKNAWFLMTLQSVMLFLAMQQVSARTEGKSASMPWRALS